MFTSNEQISPPSLVFNCRVAKFCIKECPKAVNLKRIPTHKECKCREFSLQTRLGGRICSSDVIMHKGHFPTPPLVSHEMTSEERLKKFHIDDASLPRSEWCFRFAVLRGKRASANQIHLPDPGSDTSSVWNFRARSPDQ